MLVLIPLVPLLMAPHYTNWNAFANGEVANAAAVNENFVLAAAALDDFEARISALESQNGVPQAAPQVQAIADEVGALVSLAHGVTMITRTTCDQQTVSMPAAGADSGQIKHILYDVAPGLLAGCPGNTAVSVVEFQDLLLASKLKFNSPGQGVTLIYVDNLWRVTNAGALIIP